MAEPTQPRTHRVVVVGAGIGGLVSALLLAQRGLQVTLVEAAAAPGGKMRQLVVDGAPIDAGPTVFTMRWVFDQILAQAGSSLDALVGLQPLPVLARHAWRDTPTLDLHADLQASADAIARFAGPAEGRRYLGFCDEARRVYQRLEGPHIRAQRPSVLRMVRDLGPGGLATLTGLGPFASLWTRLGHHFHDPRLRQLFGRYATYCGASPWLAPATLMLIAHVEQSGVWSVRGGMHALPLALAALARERGASLHFGQAVQRILVRDGRACGVRLADGRELPADAVVFNGDASALAQGLLGDDAVRASCRRAARAAFAVGVDLGRACAKQRLCAGAPQRLLLRRLPRASSTTCCAAASCRSRARSMSVRRTAATRPTRQAVASACCAW